MKHEKSRIESSGFRGRPDLDRFSNRKSQSFPFFVTIRLNYVLWLPHLSIGLLYPPTVETRMFRPIAIIFLIVGFSLPLPAQQPSATPDQSPAAADDLKTLKQKASYLVGFDIGQDILRRELDIDQQLLIRGLIDALAKKQPPLSEAEMDSVMTDFEKQVAAKANAKWAALAKTNMEQGIKFLNENKLKDGVIQLESGLQFEVLQPGSGKQPQNGDRVKIHVKGQRLDGDTFEDTYETKMPVTVTVGVTLRGLDEALRRMQVGEKQKLFIPAELGFGQRGSPPVIGPNETLIYEVELLEIVEQK